jgi:hypothetical protein
MYAVHHLDYRSFDATCGNIHRPLEGSCDRGHRGRARLSVLATLSSVQSRRIRKRSFADGHPVSSCAYIGWTEKESAGIDQSGLAKLELSGIRRLHADSTVRGGTRALNVFWGRPADGDHVRRGRAMAMPSVIDCRCAGKSWVERSAHSHPGESGPSCADALRSNKRWRSFLSLTLAVRPVLVLILPGDPFSAQEYRRWRQRFIWMNASSSFVVSASSFRRGRVMLNIAPSPA